MPGSWVEPPNQDGRITGSDDGGSARAASRLSRGPVVIHMDADHQVLARRATLLERVVSRVRADALDRDLAEGANPDRSGVLALRAQALASPATRRALARSLLRLQAAADAPRRRTGSTVPVARGHIHQAHAELAEVVEHLLAPAPVAAQGVALVKVLLQDAAGPLYRDGCQTDLGRLAHRAAVELAPDAHWGLRAS